MPHAHLDGIDIAYETIGQGEPIVLIMGIGAQMLHWHDAFCADLAGRGYQVIRFDNREVGGSTRLDHLGRPGVRRNIARFTLGRRFTPPYTLSEMAGDVVGLMDTLGLERAHVVGASMGGMIAQGLAIEHPDRLATLTMIMSSPGGRRASLCDPRALAALLAPRATTREGAMDRTVHLFRAIGSPGFPADEAAYRDMAGRTWDRGEAKHGFERQLCAVLASGNRTGRLRGVRTPTLVVHGAADPLILPRAGRALAKAIPGARFRVIDGMGHDLPRGVWPTLIDEIDHHARRSPVHPASRSVSSE